MPEEIKISGQQMQSMFDAMEANLDQKQKDKYGALMIEMQTMKHQQAVVATKSDLEQRDAKLAEMSTTLSQFMEDAKKNQVAIDNLIIEQQKKAKTTEKKDFGSAWAETIANEIATKQAEIQAFTKDSKATLRIDLKVGTMVIANVTGDAVQSYNSRQGLVPNQKVNIRDIIPTTQSPTGSFVTYRETGTSGSIGVQTEASSKSQIDYSFTEVKTVSKYIAGYARFSKQLMFALPFLQQTLPRVLLRDFYKKENDYIYSAMQTAAQGDASTTGAANTAEQAIQLIANQRTADFNSSFILTDWLTWARIMATKGTTEYGVPGGVVIDASGNVRLAGVPIIGASFADASGMTLWDNDQVERVETETLSVTFSFEDQDNFIKNLVTAKVECFEELNVLRPDAIIDTTTS